MPFNLDPDLRKALDEQLDAGARDDTALIARVKARVMGTVRLDALQTVRRSEGVWAQIAPGVERKLLWSDGHFSSILLRVQPGGSLPAHLHLDDEECLVLEGIVKIEPDVVLFPGDYHLARKGSRHGLASTETGALVFLRGVCEA